MKKENTQQNSNRRNFLKTAGLVGAVACVPTILVQSCAEKKEEKSTENKDTMKKRILGSGSTKMEVSALGFGVMGMNYHRGTHPDKKAMLKLLAQTVERGVTLFDTAETYGPFFNEELAGEGLSQFKDKIAITTKFGFDYTGNKKNSENIGLNSRPERIREMVEASLKRLRIEVIELLYQHRLDPQVPIEEVAGTVKDLIQEGKVKRFGLCEVSAETIRKAHAVQPITAVQSEYHLMWREVEKEVLPVCEELGIGFVPYSPVNRGMLAGGFTPYTRFDSGNDNRNILPRFQPETLLKNLRYVEELNKFGRSRGMTIAQVALGWLLQKAPWIVPIPGTTKLSHLEENLRTTDFVLPSEDWASLENILSQIPIIGERYPTSEQKKVAK